MFSSGRVGATRERVGIGMPTRSPASTDLFNFILTNLRRSPSSISPSYQYQNILQLPIYLSIYLITVGFKCCRRGSPRRASRSRSWKRPALLQTRSRPCARSRETSPCSTFPSRSSARRTLYWGGKTNPSGSCRLWGRKDFGVRVRGRSNRARPIS